MNALDWLRDPKQHLIRPVIVIFGDDAYLIRESIHAVVQTVFPDPDGETSVTRFSGSTVCLADVLDEVRTTPFFSRNRLVVVEDADPFVTKHRKELETYVANPFKSGRLLLQPRSWVATTNLAKAVASTGLVIDCGSPREGELRAVADRFGEDAISSGTRRQRRPAAHRAGRAGVWDTRRRSREAGGLRRLQRENSA